MKYMTATVIPAVKVAKTVILTVVTVVNSVIIIVMWNNKVQTTIIIIGLARNFKGLSFCKLAPKDKNYTSISICGTQNYAS